MKIAVLADIHSNEVALKACHEYIKKRDITNFIFLGDFVSDCAYPTRTMDFIYELKRHYTCQFIRGNREDYLLDERKQKEFHWRKNTSATGSLYYTYKQLREKDFAFFDSLPIYASVQIKDYKSLAICHGSKTKSNEKIVFGSSNLDTFADMFTEKYILCAHTHIQGAKQIKDKIFINPGSVGVPWYFDGKAQFCILESDKDEWKYEFVQLNYDKEEAIENLYASGLSEEALIWAKLVEHTLRTGMDKTDAVLERAVQLAKSKQEPYDWQNLSETNWHEAARLLNIV